MESVFGVLRGAFSAYRYTRLKGVPLQKYFEGEILSINISKATLYLAEGRILSFELVTKKNEPWLLKYVEV
jgi:chitin synthase